MLRPNSSSSHGAIGSFPDQSGDSLDTPRLDFEAWRALFRSNCGGEVEVTEPNAFAGWMRPLSVSGLAAAAVKIQWDSAVVDLGCNVHRVERNARDVRRNGVDHHLILYQIAGQSALTQNDQAVRLAVGDVALVDATRPVTYSTNSRSVQWLAFGCRGSRWCPTLASSYRVVLVSREHGPAGYSSTLFGMPTK